MTEPADIAVEVVGLGKNYGAVTALKSVSFSIESGKYYALLGPSGGGKTTLLRLIGGFLRPSAGRVYLHGSDVSHLPPNRRPTSMVFQNYALFPHMTVERNVAYGLKLLKVPAGDIRDRVDRMLSMVGLEGYNRRMPHELSGGQQQRVQLARSLVLERDILLLDEPLASLDAKLRKDMCLELKRIQEKVGITFIHVTHNQEEALTVADRIAIIADGELVEEGTARDVYETPNKRFTAEFIGDNNVLEGTVADISDARIALDIGFAKVEVPAPAAAPSRPASARPSRSAPSCCAWPVAARTWAPPGRSCPQVMSKTSIWALPSRISSGCPTGRRPWRASCRATATGAASNRVRRWSSDGPPTAPACTLPDAAASSKPNRRGLRRSRSLTLLSSR